MAGSFNHIVELEGNKFRFRGTDLLDNLGDAYEALEECFYIIAALTDGDLKKIYDAVILMRKRKGSTFTEASKSETFEHWLAVFERKD